MSRHSDNLAPRRQIELTGTHNREPESRAVIDKPGALDDAAPGGGVCDCEASELPSSRQSTTRPLGSETTEISHAQDEAVKADGTEVGNGRRINAPAVSNASESGTSETLTLTTATYALINIRNSTNSVVVFEFKWGTGPWQTRSLDPQASRNFWWTYAPGPSSSPTFYVRRGSIYALRRNAADQITVDQAAKYEFLSTGLLRAVDGEIFPGDWSQVAWFAYGNWNAGMYVNGVRVERYMGPTNGYNWNYRVQIVDVSLSSGLPCLPGQHWEGLVRAKVSGPGVGYLDTGDMAVHSSGGTKTQTFEPANPGDITTCNLWRQTWCEW